MTVASNLGTEHCLVSGRGFLGLPQQGKSSDNRFRLRSEPSAIHPSDYNWRLRADWSGIPYLLCIFPRNLSEVDQSPINALIALLVDDP